MNRPQLHSSRATFQEPQFKLRLALPISSTRETQLETVDTVDDNSFNPASAVQVDSIARTPTLPMTPHHLPFSDLETPRPPTPSPPKLPSLPPASSTREHVESSPPGVMSPTKEPLTAPPAQPAPIPPPPSTSISHTPRRSGRQRQAPSCLGYDG